MHDKHLLKIEFLISKGTKQLFTEALAHRQVGADDVLFAQQEDIAHINVVGGHIHAEQLHPR